MQRIATRHWPAIVLAFLAAGSLTGPYALAVPITGTVQLTNGSLGSIAVSESQTSLSGPVHAEATSTVSGAETGVTLGTGIAEGTPDGDFSVGVSGQDTHAHEASFQLTEILANTAEISQLLTMSFVIDAGRLSTIAREIPPAPGGFLEAGYDIQISFDGRTVFESNALLRQVRVSDFSSTAAVTRSGTSLGGELVEVEGFAEEFVYRWDSYAGSVNLGILEAGATGVLQYNVRSFVAAEGDRFGGTLASIGDPFDVDGSAPRGGSLEFTLSDAVSATTAPRSVPEPGSLALLAAGLLGFVLSRRRN